VRIAFASRELRSRFVPLLRLSLPCDKNAGTYSLDHQHMRTLIAKVLPMVGQPLIYDEV
jgi:hypothetical protein